MACSLHISDEPGICNRCQNCHRSQNKTEHGTAYLRNNTRSRTKIILGKIMQSTKIPCN